MRSWTLALVVGVSLGVAGAARAADPAPAAAAPVADTEAAYTADLEKRADGVLKELALADSAKAERVKKLVVDQYRALRDVHAARDNKLAEKQDKAKVQAQTEAALKPVHEKFVAGLAAELTPEQVETVKDKLTYNVVKVTYDAYCDELPQLTEAQKAYILAQLKEAREIAMDQGSSKEKHAVFGKYKGRINNYLSKEGYDLKKAEKEWAERRKARAGQAK